MSPAEARSGVRTVVVPVDGSDESVRAVPLGSRLASVLGSELVVVSVISDFRSEAPALVERLRVLLDDLPAAVERRIVQSRTVAATLAEESSGGLVCIATTAEPFDDDGFRHTVTDGLIAAATSPVVVLGPRCPAEAAIARIVVAVDPAHDQDGLLYWSTRLGYELKVPVDLVHVATTDAVDAGPNVRVLGADGAGSVADRLVAETEGALLAMGSHGRTGFRRLIQGSVGAAVIARATAPVLVLGPNVDPHR